jgi:hypothetical protein
MLATPVYASVLSVQSLPAYINTNNFKLSCTSDGGVYQFEVSKHGGAFSAFGPSIDTDTNPCIVQVDSSVVNEQTDYTFRVGGKTTSTFYDASGPSPVSGYYKERISDGAYKLHWRNPSDTDFDKVVIYRGDTVDFSADSGHEIARVNGSPNSDMTYEDHFAPDSSRNYFYAIRALDHAGNSSSLAGDGSTTETTVVVQGTPRPASGSVTILPSEGGSVLGTEASPTPEAEVVEQGGVVDQVNEFANQAPEPFKWILTHKKISLGIALIIVGAYLFIKSKLKK